MNSPLLRTADWLRLSPESASGSDATHEAQLGALAVLAAGLELTGSLEPPVGVVSVLRSALATLPPQFAGIAPESLLGEWLNVAALSELLQAPQLADLILVELIERLAPRRPGHLHGYAQGERAELAALCWARRGRVARTQGRLADAEACYHAAIGSAARTWRDARPQALVGLAVLAVNRGNFPEGERLAFRVLSHRPHVFSLYRIQAHQVATFTLRRRGSYLDALLHGWRAFDLLQAEDIRRDEIIVTMSEIAMAFGNLEAAGRGFASVRHAMLPPRVRVPALAGALDVTVRRLAGARVLGDDVNAPESASTLRRSVQVAREPLLTIMRGPLAPGDSILAVISLAEAALELGQFAEAAQWISTAGQTAATHGFHEKQFHVDALAPDSTQA